MRKNLEDSKQPTANKKKMMTFSFYTRSTFKHSENIDNSGLIYYYHILKTRFAHLQELQSL